MEALPADRGPGLRIKLAGDVSVSPNRPGQERLQEPARGAVRGAQLNLRGGDARVLHEPEHVRDPQGERARPATTTASPRSAAPSRRDRRRLPRTTPVRAGGRGGRGHPGEGRRQLRLADRDLAAGRRAELTGLKLSLPAGAVGSLAAAPQCPLAQAQAGTCPEPTAGRHDRTPSARQHLLTVPGELYLAEAPAGDGGDRGHLRRSTCPAKSARSTSARVVLMNRVCCASPTRRLRGLRGRDHRRIPTIARGRAAADPAHRDPGRPRRASSSTRPAASRAPLTATFTSARAATVHLEHPARRRRSATSCRSTPSCA